MDTGRNPDIQRLLATLRDATAADTTRNNNNNFSNGAALKAAFYSNSSNTLTGFSLVREPTSTSVNHEEFAPTTSAAATSAFHSTAPELQRRSVASIVPDASNIIAWPAALKHVTKHIVPNEKMAARIKHLMTEQQKHEQQWWTGREAIVARHNGRLGNQQKAAELLKSLGGLSRPLTPLNPAEREAELAAYDRKVYKGTVDMAADFDKQLRALGVPFFAIKHDLVILEEGIQKEGTKKDRIDKGELRELQKKMIQALEDLLGDD